nr:hypothetical protein OG999_27815 [Streptomyces sp. NBC_00886]
MWQRIVPVAPAIGMSVVLLTRFRTGRPSSDELLAWLVMWVALLALDVVLPSYFGITLTPSAAVVRNLRRRTIPWADIQGVQIESILGTRSVVLHEADGRRTRLRAPFTGFLAWDRHFEEKFHVIGRWWLDHRGPDWTPAPPPPTWWNTPYTPERNPFAPPG